MLTPEDIERIEQAHKAAVTWQNGSVGWECSCGGPWPCPVLQLAAEAHQQRARVRRAQQLADEVRPGEYWWRG